MLANVLKMLQRIEFDKIGIHTSHCDNYIGVQMFLIRLPRRGVFFI